MRWLLLICVTALASCVVPVFPTTRVAAPVTAPSRNLDPVSRAVAAMGGVEALRALRSASIRGTAKHWEPEQSQVPGGDARFAAESSFELTLDFVNQRARTDWVKRFSYPSPRTFNYAELVTPEAGYVVGVDSNSRNARSRASHPPAHTMSGLRLAAALRELRRSSPTLLLEMHDHPERVQRRPNVVVDTVAYPALSYNAGSYSFIVMFDPHSGLPARVRSLDYDNLLGNVDFDLVLSD